VIENILNRRKFEKQDTLLQHGCVIAHGEVGGITDGSWSLRSDLNLELKFTAVKRNLLGLVLRSTLGGRLLEDIHPLMTIFKEL